MGRRGRRARPTATSTAQAAAIGRKAETALLRDPARLVAPSVSSMAGAILTAAGVPGRRTPRGRGAVSRTLRPLFGGTTIMRKQGRKLNLRRETLYWLQAGDLSWVRGRDEISIQSGETHCWCTDSCETQVKLVTYARPIKTTA